MEFIKKSNIWEQNQLEEAGPSLTMVPLETQHGQSSGGRKQSFGFRVLFSMLLANVSLSIMLTQRSDACGFVYFT